MTQLHPTAVAAALRDEDAEHRRRTLSELHGKFHPAVLPLLIQALADDDWRVRKEAARCVGAWPDVSAATASLVSVLSSVVDVGQRNAAIAALSIIGAAACDAIITAIAVGGRNTKFFVEAVGAVGDARAVPALLSCLDDPDPNLRVSAVEALAEIGGDPAAEALRHAIGSEHALLRVAALDALVRLGVRVPLPEVVPWVDDPVARPSAVRLCGLTGDPAAAQHILAVLDRDGGRSQVAALLAAGALLSRTSGHEHAAVAQALAGLSDAARVPLRAILATPEMPDDAPRVAAAQVLAAAGDVASVPLLVGMLSDGNVSVACSDALVALGPAAVPGIASVARELDPYQRAELFDVIGQAGIAGSGIEAILVDALGDADPGVGAAAARALGEVGGHGAVAVIRAQLTPHAEPEVASGATRALGRLAARGVAPEAVADLLSALGHGDPDVRAAACASLGDLADEAYAAPLAACLTDDDPYARLAAIRALGALGPPGHDQLRLRIDEEDDAEMVAAIREAMGDASGSHFV